MKRLIFDKTLDGHHLEYLHHIYMGAINDRSNEYIICVPEKFFNIKNDLTWPVSSNIRIIPISEKCLSNIRGGNLRRCWNESKLVYQLIKKSKSDEVLLINLAAVVPFLLLFCPNKIKISGIIYQIYLYDKQSFAKKLIDVFRYSLMSKIKSVKNIFILNDQFSTTKLNTIYSTTRFKFIADPIPIIEKEKVINLRKELNILENTKVFLHFGAMSERKGTLILLDAIKLIPSDYNACFIFAGVVAPEIRSLFYEKVKNLKEITN